MLIEKIELTMSHVNLGNLKEKDLLIMFGNSLLRHLVVDTNKKPSEIKDSNGFLLYPAYYMTHLKVPLNKTLNTFKLWDSINIGVDVSSFGSNILESQYILGLNGEISDKKETWDSNMFPTMSAGNIMVIDASENAVVSDQLSIPIKGCLAPLSKLKKPPFSLQKALSIKNNLYSHNNHQLKNIDPIIYSIFPIKDAIPNKHMIFANFIEIMDVSEYEFFTKRLVPAISDKVLETLYVVERETFYYGNSYYGEELEIYIKASFKNSYGENNYINPEELIRARLFIEFEIYQKSTFNLLVVSFAEKVIIIPKNNSEIINEVRSILDSYLV